MVPAGSYGTDMKGTFRPRRQLVHVDFGTPSSLPGEGSDNGWLRMVECQEVYLLAGTTFDLKFEIKGVPTIDGIAYHLPLISLAVATGTTPSHSASPRFWKPPALPVLAGGKSRLLKP
jgi:hypothetical protein